MTNVYNIYKILTQSFYESCKNEQNRFVLVNGTGYVFAYLNLVMS